GWKLHIYSQNLGPRLVRQLRRARKAFWVFAPAQNKSKVRRHPICSASVEPALEFLDFGVLSLDASPTFRDLRFVRRSYLFELLFSRLWQTISFRHTSRGLSLTLRSDRSPRRWGLGTPHSACASHQDRHKSTASAHIRGPLIT